MTASANAPSRIVILAAIDHTSDAEDVVRTAATLGQTLHGAELHFLHVVKPMTDSSGSHLALTTLPELLEQARGAMEATTQRARELFSGRIIGHRAAGTPWREILQLGANLQADLIVVGSHQRGTVERWLLGSVSEQVVRKASCAVLVARPKDYHTAGVPEIEPPCTDCLEMQRGSAGNVLWCAKHQHKALHPHAHLHYEMPPRFAVGSMLLRPDG